MDHTQNSRVQRTLASLEIKYSAFVEHLIMLDFAIGIGEMMRGATWACDLHSSDVQVGGTAFWRTWSFHDGVQEVQFRR